MLCSLSCLFLHRLKYAGWPVVTLHGCTAKWKRSYPPWGFAWEWGRWRRCLLATRTQCSSGASCWSVHYWWWCFRCGLGPDPSGCSTRLSFLFLSMRQCTRFTKISQILKSISLQDFLRVSREECKSLTSVPGERYVHLDVTYHWPPW